MTENIRAALDRLLAALQAGSDVTDRAIRTAEGLATVLQVPVDATMNTALNTASTPRNRHIPRGKIEADAALEAFCRAHAQTLTLPSLAAAIVNHFGPARRVSVSSIHRWWHSRGKTLPDPTAANYQL